MAGVFTFTSEGAVEVKERRPLLVSGSQPSEGAHGGVALPGHVTRPDRWDAGRK